MKKVLVPSLFFGLLFTLTYLFLHLFIQPAYRVEATVYPTATNNPQHFVEVGLRFGDEKELNELIELMESEDVIADVITRLNLTAHYSAASTAETIKHFRDNFSISRSINRSIHIEVYDKSVDFAKKIIAVFFDVVHKHHSSIVMQNIDEQIGTLTKLYVEKQQTIATLRDSLQKLEKMGEIWVEGLVLMKTPRYRYIDKNFENEMEKLVSIVNEKEVFEDIKRKDIPYFHIVSTPFSTNKPVKPNKLLVSFLVALTSSLLLILINNKAYFLAKIDR